MNNKVKRVLCSVFAAASLAVCAVAPTVSANAAVNDLIEVSAFQLNQDDCTYYTANINTVTRSVPGTQYGKVSTVYKGERVTVHAVNNGWGYIGTVNKKQRWVKLSSFTKSARTARVTTVYGVNIRSYPADSAKPTGVLSYGTNVKIYRTIVEAGGRTWGAIDAAETKWICCVAANGNKYVTFTS